MRNRKDAAEVLVSPPRTWWLYLLECRGGAYYAGITTDVPARVQTHAAGRGARYTRAHLPLRLIASKSYPDRPSALRAEWAVKQLRRAQKLAFFTGAL